MELLASTIRGNWEWNITATEHIWQLGFIAVVVLMVYLSPLVDPQLGYVII